MKIMNYWMVFQMLLGVWLFVSPFVFGFTELTPETFNSMIVGSIITISGLGAFLFEHYHREEICKLGQPERRSS